MNKYSRLWTSDEYQAGIYEGCTAKIDVRKDGIRARLTIDEVKWNNNMGTFACKKVYIDGRPNVRKLVSLLRREQTWNLKNGIEKNCFCAMDRLYSYTEYQF